MRILIHSRTFLPRVGGLEQASLALARGLAQGGHEVVVATDVPGGSEGDRHLGFDVARGVSKASLVSLARSSELVHSNGHSMVTLAAAHVARRPLVVTHHGYQAVCLSGLGWHGGERCGYELPRCIRLTWEHDGAARTTRQLVRHTIARGTMGWATAHVGVSQFVADALRIRDISVVYNAADTSIFRSGQAKGRRDSFLFVGRFVGEKGVPDLLRAFARYRERGGSRKLRLVGAGPEESRYRDLIAELQVHQDVELMGTLRGQALAETYRESLAVLVPSVWDEAFGIVAAEAMCSGRVAIVSRAGGLPEVVGDREATVPPGDIEGWARAMHRLDQDERWRTALEAKLPTLVDRFTPERMVEAYLSVYERVLGSRATSVER